MGIVLWGIAIVLTAMFLGSGLVKLLLTREQLKPKMEWIDDYSTLTVKFLGASQLLGAIGLIVPAATGIAPVLTPIAAVCLAVLMTLATVVNLRHGDTKHAVLTVVLTLLALFLAVCRFGSYAF